MNKTTILFLIALLLINFWLHLFRFSASPPGFNADEAAYGYNAYSLLTTGKDEFGTPFPLWRLRSYGDYKLPGYLYATVPSVALFGVNEFAVRLPAIISAMALVIVIYLLTRELTRHEATARIAALLAALAPSLNILSRHAHESVLMSLCISFALWCFLRTLNAKRPPLWYPLLFMVSMGYGLFTYHSARLFYAVLVPLFISILARKKQTKNLGISLLVTALFLIPFITAELQMPPSRLGTLFIAANPGIHAMQQELSTISARSPFSTTLFIIGNEILRRYVSYFSPEYLTYHGDTNPRFGFIGMSLFSIIEIGFAIVGLYWALRRIKSRGMWLLLLILLIAPLPGALTWQEYSLIRTYTLSIPIILFIAIGIGRGYEQMRTKIFRPIFMLLIAALLLCTLRTWEFFFYHYPSRAIVVRAWEAGFPDLAQFVSDSYNDYDHYYITTDIGQAYMFLLFYLRYDPQKYQASARASKPDEYGYSQVPGFDKFSFSNDAALPVNLPSSQKVVQVLTEAQSKNLVDPPYIHRSELRRIVKGTETMFVLYEITASRPTD